MRDLLDYPLGALRSAFRTILGWTAVMGITSIGSFVVARCIEEVSLAPLWQIPITVAYMTIGALLCLPVIGAFMGTGLGWYLGLVADSFRFRLVIAVANGALWAAIGLWVHF